MISAFTRQNLNELEPFSHALDTEVVELVGLCQVARQD